MPPREAFFLTMIKHFTLFIPLFLVTALSAFGQNGGGFSGGGFSESGSSQGGGSYNGGGSSGGSGIGIIVSENYILKPSDVVSVDVYQEEDLDKQVRIEGDGSVALPLVGKVRIAGMTVAEAQDLIRDLYNRDYLVDPQISLIVTQFSPKVVTILGSVNGAGKVDMPPDRDLTLTEAMAAVGGISRLGNPKNVLIKRVDGSGRARQMEVNFSKIVTDPNVKDIVLQEGDTVWVSERIF